MLNNLLTIMIAAAGGALFYLLGIPIPWMLGSLTVVLAWKSTVGKGMELRPEIRNGAQIILGLVMGKSFTREAAWRVAEQLPAIVISTVSTILFSLLMAYLIYKFCRVSLPSAILGSIPGGLSQMVLLCEEVEDAETTIVTIMQTIRLLLVVFMVPFVVQKGLAGHVQAVAASRAGLANVNPSYIYLAIFLALAVLGALAATRLKLPTSYLVGPVLITAFLILLGLPSPQVPRWLIVTAQVIMGTFMGLRFQLQPGLRRLFLLAVASNIIIILFTFGIGYLLTLLHGQSLMTSFLSMAPGGMSEMGIAAVAVGADLALVTSYQLFRILFILLVVPHLLRRLFKRISRANVNFQEH